MDPDELFTLRNYFWLGLYKQAITEGQALSRGLPEKLKLEKEEFLYRSYVAAGQFSVVLAQINESSAPSLQAIRLLASYLSQPENRDIVLLTLNEWLSDPTTGNNPTLRLIAANVFLHEGSVKDALKAVHEGVTIEQIALLAQIYLRMDRLDLAISQHKVMLENDEDAPLTHLVGGLVAIASGGSKKAQEAAYTFDELIDKYSASILLLNCSAVAKMHLGEFQEADSNLKESYTKDNKNADTLINLIACSRQLGKSEAEIEGYIAQLKEHHPNHSYIQGIVNLESIFARVNQSLAIH